MRVVLATGNRDKVAELEPLLPDAQVSGAPEGFDPAETGTTLLQNAWIKAAALRPEAPGDALVVADDSGLIVHALGGRPGAFSSRYAGPDATYADNCLRLLEELEGVEDRRAAFVCACLAGAIAILITGVLFNPFLPWFMLTMVAIGPSGLCGTQQAFATSASCAARYQSVVHSQTLPIMSTSP